MTNRNVVQMVYGAVREEAERLLPQLDDPQPEVREAAAEALGRVGAFEAVPALIRLLDDSEGRVRWAAAGALGEIGSADAAPALLPLLEDGDAGTREVATQALGEIGSDQAVDGLLKRLKDPSGHVRLMAIEALGQIGSSEALEALRECANSEDESEKLCAVEAIGMIRSSGAELLEADWENASEPMLSEHPSLPSFAEGVRGAWEPWQLEHVRGCDFCQRLVTAEWNIRQPEIRTLAAYAANQDGFPYAAAMRQHLEKDNCRRCALLSRTPLVFALAALARLGKTLEVTALGLQVGLPQLQELASPAEDVNGYESEGSSALTLHQGAGGALLAFADISPREAASGRVLLEIIGENGHRCHDLEVGRDERVGTVKEARQEFGEDVALLAASLSPQSLDELSTWMRDSSVELRAAAIETAGAFRRAVATPEILDLLTEALRDPDSTVRAAAVQALGRMATAAVRAGILAGLLTLFRDPVEAVRSAAIRACRDLAALARTLVLAQTQWSFAGVTADKPQPRPQLFQTSADESLIANLRVSEGKLKLWVRSPLNTEPRSSWRVGASVVFDEGEPLEAEFELQDREVDGHVGERTLAEFDGALARRMDKPFALVVEWKD